jgi:HK97 family phage portal protein
MAGLLRKINSGLGKKETVEVKAAKPVQISSSVPLVSPYTQTRSLQIDFESLTKWAFRSNELVHSCIGERGKAFREPPLRIYNETNDKWEEGNPVEVLLKQPNPFRSQAEFWEAVEQHLLLVGNAFIYKARDKTGKVAQLWLKKPNQIKVVPHPKKFISHYLYTVGGKEYVLPVEDIIHVMYIDPDNDYYGISPLVAAAKKIDADSELGSFAKHVLLNMATTSGVFITDKKLGPDERQILEDKMASRYIGAIRAGLPMVLSHGMKYEQTSMNMKDLDIGNLSSYVESRICLALHVPAIVVGAKVGLDRSTFTNAGEAREYMYENTVAPEWQMVADKVGYNLLADFGLLEEALIPRFDTRQVKALQESEADLWQRVDEFEGLSVVEKRVKIGYGKDPDGIVYMDANKVPVDIKTGEGLTPREPDPDLAETPAGQDPEGEAEQKKNEQQKSKQDD